MEVDYSKEIIIETTGVPSGLTETGNLIYDGIVEWLHDNPKETLNRESQIQINGDFYINEFKFDTVFIGLSITENRAEFIELQQMELDNNDDPNYENKLVVKRFTYLERPGLLIITIGYPLPTIKTFFVHEFFKINKAYLLPPLIHELKHMYDFEKKPIRPLHTTAEYGSSQYRTSIDIKPMNDFLHALYYTNDIENSVRASEFSAELKLNNVKRDHFTSFMKNSDIYRWLEYAKNVKFENILSELNTYYLNRIKEFLREKKYSEQILRTSSNIEIVGIFLHFVYKGVSDIKNEILLPDSENPLEDILNMPQIDYNYFNKHLNKTENVDIVQWFIKKQRQINANGEKGLKIIGKLWNTVENIDPTRPTRPNTMVRNIKLENEMTISLIKEQFERKLRQLEQ